MKRLSILGVLVIVLTIFAFFWWNNGLSPVNPKNEDLKVFVIRPGENATEIASNLKEQGLIKDPVVFFLLVKKLGIENKIQAGDFRISKSMSAEEIAQNLTHGTIDIWVTVPEGKRAEEIAEIFETKIPSYDSSWKKELARYEGYLFPDTYLIPRDADAALVISIMKNNFASKIANVNLNKTSLTEKEVITIASLIEREARFSDDRPLVASVILNRLRIGMKLDIDATVQYAVANVKCQMSQPKAGQPMAETSECTWWPKSLSRSDLQIESSYNTYTNPGLPPTPIANPGLAALAAVVDAPRTNYLYYISDSTGKNHYAETFEEHNENINRYNL